MNENSLENACGEFIRTKESFRWFIDEYYPNSMLVLEKLAEENKPAQLLARLNIIWFELPDSKFNIKVNPKGWSEFLNLLEI